MNYRHAYHAGNFTDVFKHIVLLALTEAMLRKEKPFCYLETHAGTGYYDLLSNAAQKSKEFESGISKIIAAPNQPALITTFLSCVQALNPETNSLLRYYPGSPYLVHHLLRKEDRMVLCELHEEDWLLLKRAFPHDKQVAIHHQDGYLALKAFLPPKERRALILIDPPYEETDELSTAASMLTGAVQQFETGVYALWYPIKEHRSIDRFHNLLKERISRPLLVTELSIYPENVATHLNGSGLVIVNPPWQLDQALNQVLPWLWKVLSPNKQGRYQTKLL